MPSLTCNLPKPLKASVLPLKLTDILYVTVSPESNFKSVISKMSPPSTEDNIKALKSAFVSEMGGKTVRHYIICRKRHRRINIFCMDRIPKIQ